MDIKTVTAQIDSFFAAGSEPPLHQGGIQSQAWETLGCWFVEEIRSAEKIGGEDYDGRCRWSIFDRCELEPWI